jgi:HSP90 family molecular chaperone
MVADKIDVYSLSGHPDSVALHWQSDGHGSYTIEEVPDLNMAPGTKVVVHLKASCAGQIRISFVSLSGTAEQNKLECLSVEIFFRLA